jgi:glycosyltransferase involved in cell wall biosynthesis
MPNKKIVKSPLISIIVPNYNHFNFLEERLESIFNQTYQNFEVILLDDCSTDNSSNILSSYCEDSKVSHCVFNKTNSGNTFIQWNKGIALAKGEYIWIAESDDFCESNFLEVVLNPLIKNKDIALSYCQSNRVNEKGVKIGNWLDHTENFDKRDLFFNDFSMLGNNFIEEFLIYKNVIPNVSGVIFSKKRATELGGVSINPILKYNADWLFYIQLISNHRVAFQHEPLNNFRFHAQSVISNAVSLENRISLINIEISTRKKILQFLKKKECDNYYEILIKNKDIFKKLIKEKRNILIKNGRIFESRLLLIQHYLNNLR